jgi:hypothetical protein
MKNFIPSLTYSIEGRKINLTYLYLHISKVLEQELIYCLDKYAGFYLPWNNNYLLPNAEFKFQLSRGIINELTVESTTYPVVFVERSKMFAFTILEKDLFAIIEFFDDHTAGVLIYEGDIDPFTMIEFLISEQDSYKFRSAIFARLTQMRISKRKRVNQTDKIKVQY